MKVLMINSVCGIRSTGRICGELANQLEAQGYNVRIAYGREKVPEKFKKYAVRIGTDIDVKIHALQTRIFDTHGFASKVATKKFLLWAERFNPDILWLHNLHGYYINIEMLFEWIKKRPNMQVKWTLHDCWAFTGHCSHFTVAKCEQWKDQCVKCHEIHCYPKSWIIDNSESNFLNKKQIFTGVKNMTLITPSQWLANLVKQSFLREYPVNVHYNNIDAEVFKPTFSDFRERNGLENKKIILGVASSWTERKGITDFLKLSQMLDDTYVIVLVGVTDKQRKWLKHSVAKKNFERTVSIDDYKFVFKEFQYGLAIQPDVLNLFQAITGEKYTDNNETMASIIGISSTNNPKELAEIYTAADLFVNPTREDNYPTVNLEARACGTYVITYDVGGCVETLM